MLKFCAVCDKDLLNGLHQEIFGTVYPKDIGYVLYDGNTPIGIAMMTVKEDISTLHSVGILEKFRKNKNGDFFTRSLIWGMSQASPKVVIDYENTYFEKFGFSKNNGKMVADSEKIVFPCECHGH